MPIKPENRSRYPACWPLLSRIIRLGRARQQCEWCQALNHHPHPVTGSMVVLTVAHVEDRRPEACGFGNLAALCQRCHNRHDAWHRRNGGNAVGDLFGLQAPSGDDRRFAAPGDTARHALARPGLAQGAAIVLLVLLAGCGGTVLEMDGQICGQPVKLKMADAKDRSSFDLAVTCGPGGGVTVTTAESSASRVMEAQAEAIRGLAAQVGRRGL